MRESTPSKPVGCPWMPAFADMTTKEATLQIQNSIALLRKAGGIAFGIPGLVSLQLRRQSWFLINREC
jgi:hypothetical protein